MIIFLIYVHHIIIVGGDLSEKQLLKKQLSTKFEMNDLEQLKYFLRTKVGYSKQIIFISQELCIRPFAGNGKP